MAGNAGVRPHLPGRRAGPGAARARAAGRTAPGGAEHVPPQEVPGPAAAAPGSNHGPGLRAVPGPGSSPPPPRPPPPRPVVDPAPARRAPRAGRNPPPPRPATPAGPGAAPHHNPPAPPRPAPASRPDLAPACAREAFRRGQVARRRAGPPVSRCGQRLGSAAPEDAAVVGGGLREGFSIAVQPPRELLHERWPALEVVRQRRTGCSHNSCH